MDRGIALSRQYGVDRLLQPIFDFVPTADSPPLAPKHITAPPTRPKRRGDNGGDGDGASAKDVKAQRAAVNKAALAARRAAAIESRRLAEEEEELMESSMMMEDSDEDLSMMSASIAHGHHQPHSGHVGMHGGLGDEADGGLRSPTIMSGSSETPSPLGSEANADDDPEYEEGARGPATKKRKSNAHAVQQQQQAHVHQQQLQPDPSAAYHQQANMIAPAHAQLPGGSLRYARMILDYFVSESTQVPHFLTSPPADFDANVVIDDDGHTALHWACAMGRIRIVKLLLSAGADIFRANSMGQTALMRSVMFTNNYDLRKFPELFELLHRSTINIDRNDRTVFHYIVDIALHKGKTHAARYYIETVLARLIEYPQEVADILNFQDEEGETALTLAARARSKRLVKILLDNGADPKIANRDGKTAEDYILEDERFREQELAAQSVYGHGAGGLAGTGPGAMAAGGPDLAAGGAGVHSGATAAAGPGAAGTASSGQGHLPPLFIPHLHSSQTGQYASSKAIPQMAELLASLANAFDAELSDKDRDLTQAQALLINIEADLAESQRTAQQLEAVANQLDQLTAHEADLRAQLEAKMGKRFRLGWEKWVRDEDARESAYEDQVRRVGNSDLGQNQDDGSFERQPDLDQYRDLVAHPPADSLEQQRRLRARIDEYKARRRGLFQVFADRTAQSGTGTKMGHYRRLIALGCGVPIEQADEAIASLLDEMQQDEDFGSSYVSVQV